jgi:flagellar biosynthesis/type III secretory pathway protein FliH
MKVEQAKQTASKAIEQLTQALEAGHSEGLREYLAAIARFHNYSLLCVPQHRNVTNRTM